MSPLELTAEELAILEDALEKYTSDKDDILDALDAAHYDGIYVNEWDYEQHLRDIDLAEGMLLMIDDIWYDAGFDFDEGDEDSYDFAIGWDDIEMSYADMADLTIEDLVEDEEMIDA